MSALQDLLRLYFGSDFPVGDGSAKRDDPLVITEKDDYVAIEYRIAQLILAMADREYKFEQQQVRQVNDRTIDELVYAAKPKGAPEWTETRRFFFDVTIGFDR